MWESYPSLGAVSDSTSQALQPTNTAAQEMVQDFHKLVDSLTDSPIELPPQLQGFFNKYGPDLHIETKDSKVIPYSSLSLSSQAPEFQFSKEGASFNKRKKISVAVSSQGLGLLNRHCQGQSISSLSPDPLDLDRMKPLVTAAAYFRRDDIVKESVEHVMDGLKYEQVMKMPLDRLRKVLKVLDKRPEALKDTARREQMRQLARKIARNASDLDHRFLDEAFFLSFSDGGQDSIEKVMRLVEFGRRAKLNISVYAKVHHKPSKALVEGLRQLLTCDSGQCIEGLVLCNEGKIDDRNPDQEAAIAIAEALKDNLGLRKLCIQHVPIGEKGVKAFSEALKVNKTLTHVRLKDNFIGSKGGIALGEALGENTCLQELTVENNGIRDEGAKAFARGLSANHTLASLDLEGNGISDAGALCFGQALDKSFPAKKINLENLSLRNNKIGCLGACSLAEALSVFPRLTDLDLDGNPIGDLGILSLLYKGSDRCKLASLECPKPNAFNEVVVKAQENWSRAKQCRR